MDEEDEKTDPLAPPKAGDLVPDLEKIIEKAKHIKTRNYKRKVYPKKIGQHEYSNEPIEQQNPVQIELSSQQTFAGPANKKRKPNNPWSLKRKRKGKNSKRTATTIQRRN